MTHRISLLALGMAVAGPAFAAAHGQGYYHDDGRGFAGMTVTGCETERRDGQLAGAVIGGVLGGVAGGLAVDGDDDDHYRHGHRRYRGYRGHRGYHGYRGYGRGYAYGYGYDDDDDGEEVAGVLLGAIIGGLAGSELGRNSVNCDETWKYADVPPPTRSAVGPAWETTPYEVSSRDVGRARTITDPDLAGARDERLRECETVYRETEFPDGRIVREPVLACRDGEVIYEPRARFEEWRVAPDCGLQTRDPDCIG